MISSSSVSSSSSFPSASSHRLYLGVQRAELFFREQREFCTIARPYIDLYVCLPKGYVLLWSIAHPYIVLYVCLPKRNVLRTNARIYIDLCICSPKGNVVLTRSSTSLVVLTLISISVCPKGILYHSTSLY